MLLWTGLTSLKVAIIFRIQYCLKIFPVRRFFFWSVSFSIRTKNRNCKSPYSFQIKGNKGQRKPCIWTLFTQCKRLAGYFDQFYPASLTRFIEVPKFQWVLPNMLSEVYAGSLELQEIKRFSIIVKKIPKRLCLQELIWNIRKYWNQLEMLRSSDIFFSFQCYLLKIFNNGVVKMPWNLSQITLELDKLQLH